MGRFQQSGLLLASFILCMVDSRGIAGNVKLVAMNGNQYWFSTSSPYAPTLNFHLAYQYCRTLGLQLAVLETTEEVETISAYLNRDANPMTHGKYWTSGNRLGAESWIWMSSGEQLNSSFADYWLKNGVGAATPENPRHCMSMKPPISPMTKRAIFTAEECNKAFPFICEQVRCLYYNYPVMMFPDPSELRTDIDHDGTSVSPSESESRTSIQYSTSEQIQNKNVIPTERKSRQLTTLTTDIEGEESGRIDGSNKIQRKMMLRPVMSVYPIPSHSYNKYKLSAETSTLASTKKPFYNKATHDNLWGPSSSTESTNPTLSTGLAKLRKLSESSIFNSKRPTIFITGKAAKPSNSTFTSAKIINNETTPKPFAQYEIVTSKSTTVDGEEIIDDLEDTVAATMLYHRYGSGSGPSDPTHIFASGYISTDPSVVLDDEQNNVGGEVGLEDATLSRDQFLGTIPKFFEGSGIRRPDMSSTTRFLHDENEVTTTTQRGNSPTTTPKLQQQYTFQRGKSSLGSSWIKAKLERGTPTPSTAASIIADSIYSATEKMGLGPRLKLRLRPHN
ncbi:uncharacterized protein LOC110855170 [Folsomia candida]|uniref:uncharacterized protein LOC110855170 n=1 Tax=Folsomia candida TaxID=158441 RepID=UPI000B9095EA|nr:uncharacterized protein LOC110855170 [Folsomia candida]